MINQIYEAARKELERELQSAALRLFAHTGAAALCLDIPNTTPRVRIIVGEDTHIISLLSATAPPQDAQERKQLMARMVDAFLSWPLPSTFAPDCGISFDGSWVDARGALVSWPIGTNLFTAREAQLMVEHMFAVADAAMRGKGNDMKLPEEIRWMAMREEYNGAFEAIVRDLANLFSSMPPQYISTEFAAKAILNRYAIKAKEGSHELAPELNYIDRMNEYDKKHPLHYCQQHKLILVQCENELSAAQAQIAALEQRIKQMERNHRDDMRSAASESARAERFPDEPYGTY